MQSKLNSWGVLERNGFGFYRSNGRYEEQLPWQDYQSRSPDCVVSSRTISNVSSLNCLPEDIANYMRNVNSQCRKTVLSSTVNKGIGGQAISIPKRSRTVFQPHQIQRLQYEFERGMYMVGTKRRNLSQELELTEKQIKIWFQNRRMKQKRDHERRARRVGKNIQENRIWFSQDKAMKFFEPTHTQTHTESPVRSHFDSQRNHERTESDSAGSCPVPATKFVCDESVRSRQIREITKC